MRLSIQKRLSLDNLLIGQFLFVLHTADRNRLTRAQRRLANAKTLAAAKLAAKTNEAEQQKSK